MHGLKPALIGLYNTVILSYRSTLLGLLVAGVAYGLGVAQSYPNHWVQLGAGLILVPFLAWKDKAVAAGTIRLLVVGLVAFSALGARAQASPPARTGGTLADVAPSDPLPPAPPSGRKIGGCTKSGYVCVGPSAAITVAALNLSKKKVEGSFAPGVGLGVTMNSGSWASYGVSVYLNLDPGAQNASAAVLASFLNGYARAGWSKGFLGDVSSRLLFGIGIDL